MKLKNGARVIDWKQFCGFRAVIAEYLNQYVVWRAYPASYSENEFGLYSCEHGTYHKTISDAVKSFDKRFSKCPR